MSGTYIDHTDVETWLDFKAGNEAAFAYLYNRYVVDLYHYGNRLTSDRALIEDCIQDLFIEIWQHRTTLGETDSVKFYLYKALKRKMIKRLVGHRKRADAEVLPDAYDIEMVFSPEFELIAQQVSEVQRSQLLAALNALTIRQKEAITLKFYDGLSYQEVATLMGMSLRATYNLIYRAIEALRIYLDKLTFLSLPWL